MDLNNDTIHCCKAMTNFLEDERIGIIYRPNVREYAMPLLGGSTVIQLLFYCPWCGVKLPASLREEYLEILEQDFGITDFFGEEARSKFPKDFQSDVWWKKRGL